MKSTLILALLFLRVIAFGQQTLESTLDTYAKAHSFNGVALVATDGKIDLLKAIGIDDRTTGSAIKVDSKFRIASISKTFTAVVAMRLVQDGKLKLDGTIGQYFPAYKGPARDQVTIHQLLTYASGIENQLEKSRIEPYVRLIGLDAFIDTYCSGPLVAKPGEKSVYGNTEYIILQKIIENASGQPLAKLLHDYIFDPLQLKNTGIIDSKKRPVGLVQNYLFDESAKTFKLEPDYAAENFFAAGNLYSTAQDLLTFSDALFNNRLLDAKTTETMLSIHPELGYTAYGLWGSDGWGNFDEKFYYRTGGIQGANANWIATRKSNKTIIVLSNTNATNLYELSEKLYLAGK